MFGGSDIELRSFIANLQMGKKAHFASSGYSRSSDRIEMLKSAGYMYTWQRNAEGLSIATVFLPDLFRLDPGMVDPLGVNFIVLPTEAWIRSQKIVDAQSIVRHAKRTEVPLSDQQLEALVPVAFLFAAYLDRRTQAPLLSDGRFYLQLLLASLKIGLASWPQEYYHEEFGINRRMAFKVTDAESVGLARGIAFSSTHNQVETLLAEEVQRFFTLTKGRLDRKSVV